VENILNDPKKSEGESRNRIPFETPANTPAARQNLLHEEKIEYRNDKPALDDTENTENILGIFRLKKSKKEAGKDESNGNKKRRALITLSLELRKKTANHKNAECYIHHPLNHREGYAENGELHNSKVERKKEGQQSNRNDGPSP
jgi:hypothetical protein